jgi:hypothetical protein
MRRHHDVPIDSLRRKFLTGLGGGLALSTPLSLIGCGGGGDATGADSGSQGTTSADDPTIAALVAKLPQVDRTLVKVGVALPAGSGIDLTSTTLLSGNSNMQVGSDGTSGVVLVNGSPQMAYLFDRNGRLLLMSVIEPGVRTSVDSRGTAEAIVSIASEAALYGPAMELAVREVLRTHAIIEPVRLAVEGALARNGVDDADSALTQAIATAVAAMRKPPATAAAADGRKRTASVTVLPETALSGVTVATVPDTFNSIAVTNAFRRRTYVWVTQVGYFDASGNPVQLAPPAPVKDFELSATTALSFDTLVAGVGDLGAQLLQDIGFLGAYERGNGWWSPVTSDPVALTVSQDAAEVAVFRTRVVGVGVRDGEPLSADESAKLDQLLGATLWSDILLPLLKTFILPVISQRVAGSFSNTAGALLLTATTDMTNLQISGSYFPATVNALRAGNAQEVLLQFWAEFLSSDTWLKLLETAIQAWEAAGKQTTLLGGLRDANNVLIGVNLLDPSVAAKQIAGAMAKFARIIEIVKLATALGDYAAMVKDWSSSDRVDEFTTNVSRAKIALTPSPAMADPLAGAAGKASVTAAVTGLDGMVPADSVFLEWVCSGKYGNLVQANGNGINSFESTLSSATQDYFPTGVQDDPSTPDTIEVTAFYRNATTNQRVEMGSASVNVKMKKLYTLKIAGDGQVPADGSVGVTAAIKEVLPASATVAWTWTHGGVGSITAIPADDNLQDNAVTFNAGPSEGTGTATATATVTVGSTVVVCDPVTATLTVKKGLKTVTVKGYFACDAWATGAAQCYVRACMVFPKVANAISYEVQASGFNDPYYFGTSIDSVIPAANMYQGRPSAADAFNSPNNQDRGGSIWNGISGVVSNGEDVGKMIADDVAGMTGRFAGMQVIAIATLQS